MSKDVKPQTNGDRVDRAIRQFVEKSITQVCEHPDEVLVGALPLGIALHLSIKYDMSFADHMLITQAGGHLGMLLVKAYRQWKARPARPSLEKVI